MMNCPEKHNHTLIPPEIHGFFHIREWQRKKVDEGYELVKCKGCNKYLIWVKRDKH